MTVLNYSFQSNSSGEPDEPMTYDWGTAGPWEYTYTNPLQEFPFPIEVEVVATPSTWEYTAQGSYQEVQSVGSEPMAGDSVLTLAIVILLWFLFKKKQLT